MSVYDIQIIGPTTAQAVSNGFSSVGPRTITCSSLGVNEGVKIQFTHDGLIWQDLYLNGVLQEITQEHSMITVLGPGLFRCVKSVTSTPVSVILWASESDR